jgi:uncharacterized protein (TIGR02646 family)
MHRLDRNSVATPACLANYQYPAQNWDDVSTADKNEIRAQLELMQGRRCAYCEGPLDGLGQHIEHFRRKGHFPQYTFAWPNLYWSCDQPDSCGHYKDRKAGAYSVNDLIEPCVDDPDQFFLFRTDGTISIRSGLSAALEHRAEETLRIFNLNPRWGRLRNMRKAALSTYVSLANGEVEFSANELQEFFADELAQAVTQPFFTAIRHVLTEPPL